MVAHLVLGAVAANVVGDIGPRAQTVDLGALEQKQFLIGTPVGLEDRNGVLLDDLEGVGLRVVVLGAFPIGEAGNAEVVFRTSGMSAGDANLHESSVSRLPRLEAMRAYGGGDIDRAHVAVELGASLGAARGGLLAYYTHRFLGPFILR